MTRVKAKEEKGGGQWQRAGGGCSLTQDLASPGKGFGLYSKVGGRERALSRGVAESVSQGPLWHL